MIQQKMIAEDKLCVVIVLYPSQLSLVFMYTSCLNTVLNLILRMEKIIISILKNARFSGKGRQPLHIYTL